MFPGVSGGVNESPHILHKTKQNTIAWLTAAHEYGNFSSSVLAVLILDQNKTPVLIRQILDINCHAAGQHPINRSTAGFKSKMLGCAC